MAGVSHLGMDGGADAREGCREEAGGGVRSLGKDQLWTLECRKGGGGGETGNPAGVCCIAGKEEH